MLLQDSEALDDGDHVEDPTSELRFQVGTTSENVAASVLCFGGGGGQVYVQCVCVRAGESGVRGVVLCGL
jgi:hypothetical protein